jgi:hypothetical protein
VSLEKTRNKTDRDGRIYIITVRARDLAGNTTSTTSTVTVR